MDTDVQKDEIKERLVWLIGRIASIIGMAAYIPSVYLSIKVDLWILVIVNTLVYGFFLFLHFSKKVPGGVKKSAIAALFYLLGIILLTFTGPFGAGVFYLFGFCFFAALFYPLRIVIGANILILLTFSAYAILNILDLLQWEQDLSSIIVVTVNFILISSIISWAISWLMSKLIQHIDEQKNLHRQLQVEIEEKNKNLKIKTMLMQELHHRVKNNLQLISSLINLQKRKHTEDSSALTVIQNRLFSIAAVHNLLYVEEYDGIVPLSKLIKAVIDHIIENSSNDLITVSFNPDIDIQVPADQAKLIALIINELCTNAVKHAFSGMDRGELTVSIFQDEDVLHLNVSDNGNGYPIDFLETTGSGLQIVQALVKQLDAQISISSDNGTEFMITVPFLHH